MDRWREIGGILVAAGSAFLVVNFVHFQTVPVYVILYACAIDAVIAVPLGFALHRRLAGAPSRLTSIERALTGVIAGLGILLYAILGPTVIDRSLSLYIVEKLDQRGGSVAVAAMPEVFVEEYLPEFHVVDVRLTEQVQSGTATIEDRKHERPPRVAPAQPTPSGPASASPSWPAFHPFRPAKPGLSRAARAAPPPAPSTPTRRPPGPRPASFWARRVATMSAGITREWDHTGARPSIPSSQTIGQPQFATMSFGAYQRRRGARRSIPSSIAARARLSTVTRVAPAGTSGS